MKVNIVCDENTWPTVEFKFDKGSSFFVSDGKYLIDILKEMRDAVVNDYEHSMPIQPEYHDDKPNELVRMEGGVYYITAHGMKLALDESISLENIGILNEVIEAVDSHDTVELEFH